MPKYRKMPARLKMITMTVAIDFCLSFIWMDGLFYMLAKEETKIRKDPAARVTDLLKKVFG